MTETEGAQRGVNRPLQARAAAPIGETGAIASAAPRQVIVMAPLPTGVCMSSFRANREGRERSRLEALQVKTADRFEQKSFPRKIAPGTFWFSTCLEIAVDGDVLHNHNSCFLIVGSEASVLVDSGMPYGWGELRDQIADALEGRQLDFIFPTHPESPHMGNTEPLLETYPDSVIVGDLRNYHLYFPGHQHRFRPVGLGEDVNLGDRRLRMVPAIVHDLPNTMWAYDPDYRILFVSDGYPYTHDHRIGECALTSDELADPPTEKDTLRVIEGALNWTRHVDAEITINALEAFLVDHPTDIIGPTHGGVITNPRQVTEVFKAGLRRVRAPKNV